MHRVRSQDCSCISSRIYETIIYRKLRFCHISVAQRDQDCSCVNTRINASIVHRKPRSPLTHSSSKALSSKSQISNSTSTVPYLSVVRTGAKQYGAEHSQAITDFNSHIYICMFECSSHPKDR